MNQEPTALTPDAFGQTVAASGSTSSAYGYAGDWGYRADGDAGLMLVGARYYDAQVGRFASRDTYLDQHPYLYCEHDGVNWVDPSGHSPAVGALAPALIGAVVGVAVVGAIDYGLDGKFNFPWWYYPVGAAAGAVAGVIAVAIGAPGGVAIGGAIGINIGIHDAHHFFPWFGRMLPHIQLNWWKPGVSGPPHGIRLPLIPLGPYAP